LDLHVDHAFFPAALRKAVDRRNQHGCFIERRWSGMHPRCRLPFELDIMGRSIKNVQRQTRGNLFAVPEFTDA
jgi:hypothetical protein